MPTPPKRIENQSKHLTKAEKAARIRAERGLMRVTQVRLRVPKWLSEDAKEIFRETRTRLRGLDLLDNLDAEMLGIYCDAMAKYRAASKLLDAIDESGAPTVTDELIKNAQAWARLVAGYAEKLGMSPNARARLAKKRAEREPPDEMEELLEGPRHILEYGDRQEKV